MIHDIIFSLLIPQPGRLTIEDFVISKNFEQFLHPSECKILQDIIQIAKQYQDIKKFTKTYGIYHKGDQSLDANEDFLQKGLYLQAFTDGVDTVLENYVNEIVELEKRYLQSSTHSILFIFHKINGFQPLFTYLQKLLSGIKTQRLHGCGILQFLHQNIQHGNQEISGAMKVIFKTVNIVFLKQLRHWILYGKIIDTYGEFFIQNYECRNSTTSSEKCTSVGSSSGRNTITTVSSTYNPSTYAEVWRYDICCEFLPYYLSYSWAEKVLFIGQTVLMFKMGVNHNRTPKKLSTNCWQIENIEKNNCFSELISSSSESLWNNEEENFFGMMQTLENDECVIVSQYEKIIDDIKSFVTQRLSQIAVKQADLIKQLKLIKDFYLLGRGELFLEFIKRAQNSSERSTTSTENILRDLVKAFETAASSINITDDLDSFSLSLCKNKIHTFNIESFSCFQNLCLQYKIEWPLHLLFSPKVIDRYNELFRFLLLIKKIQYELHMIWSRNRKELSHHNPISNLMHLSHQLVFFIDNLQYYIQVDVLESQFSILMNTILNSTDFEHIQKAHSIFHANILSLCFLLSNDEQKSMHASIIQCSENPVLSILNKIFQLCEVFCKFVKACTVPLIENDVKVIASLETQFLQLIKDLMDLLVGLKAAPNSTPLSQLLLRLDFNHWFSQNNDEEESCI